MTELMRRGLVRLGRDLARRDLVGFMAWLCVVLTVAVVALAVAVQVEVMPR